MTCRGTYYLGALLLVACGTGTHLPAESVDGGPGRDGGTKSQGVMSRGKGAPDASMDGGGPARPGSCREDLDCNQSGANRYCDRRRAECVECLAHAQCGGGERCILGQCEIEQHCSDPLDCPLGAACHPDLGVCVECATDGDCATGELCASLQCQLRCDAQKDCTASGLICDLALGYCRPREEPTVPVPADAGTVCSDTRVGATRVLPTIMFLIDGSTSMEMPYGDPSEDGGTSANSTRWAAVRDAIIAPDHGVIRELGGAAEFGLAVFGTDPICPFPLSVVAPQLNNASDITNAWPPNPPGMFTPTGPALDQVVSMMADPLLSGVGPQIIVLATDGEPNDCNVDIFTGIVTDYAPSIAAAVKAQSKHVKLFVVSVADAAGEFAHHLQQMANLGAGLALDASPGATVYYPQDTSLTETLMQVLSAEIPCEITLATAVAAGRECTGTVTLNGAPLPCNGKDGWELLDATHIGFNGAACEDFRGHDVSIQANFPCDAQE